MKEEVDELSNWSHEEQEYYEGLKKENWDLQEKVKAKAKSPKKVKAKSPKKAKAKSPKKAKAKSPKKAGQKIKFDTGHWKVKGGSKMSHGERRQHQAAYLIQRFVWNEQQVHPQAEMDPEREEYLEAAFKEPDVSIYN